MACRTAAASIGAAARELGERGHGDRLGVDLEEAAQRRARVAAAEAVGAERDRDRPGTKRRDLVGDGLHVVARGDDRPRLVGEHAG